MAENKSRGAQHLTSLDLDISGVLSSLEEAKKMIEEYSIDIGNTLNKNILGSNAQNNIKTSVVNQSTDLFNAVNKALIQFENEAGKGFKSVANELLDSPLGILARDGIKFTFHVTAEEKKWLQEMYSGSLGNKAIFTVYPDKRAAEKGAKYWDSALDELKGMAHTQDLYNNLLRENDGKEFTDRMELYKAEIKLLAKLRDIRQQIKGKDSDFFDEEVTKKAENALRKFSDVVAGLREQYGDDEVNKILSGFGDEFVNLGKRAQTSSEDVERFGNALKELDSTGGKLDNIIIDPDRFDFSNTYSQLQSIQAVLSESSNKVKTIKVDSDKHNDVVRATVTYVGNIGETWQEVYSFQKKVNEEGKTTYEFVKSTGQATLNLEKSEKERNKILERAIELQEKFNSLSQHAEKNGISSVAQNAAISAEAIGGLIEDIQVGNITIDQATEKVKIFAETFVTLKESNANINSIIEALQKLSSEFEKIGNEAARRGFGTIATESQEQKAAIDALRESVKNSGVTYEEAAKQVEDYKAKNIALKESIRDKRAYDELIKELNTLERKYQTLGAKSEKSGNKELSAQIQKVVGNIQGLIGKLEQQEIGMEDARKQTAEYNKELGKISAAYVKASAANENFIKAIIDKARWYAAFQIQYQFINLLRTIPSIIKETEDAVVDLRRILNEDLSNNTISSELYEIGAEFGRSFADVSEVATRFAQAGYEWNDVIELTRGTMLALNTAELDVSQSTQGLIAILQQWKLNASDYGDVIDKINITADNFAVTSENIVAALQRASSSAANANISFEETIGIITAMAQATGRSGENIGTALNSLIIYTQKASSLEVFASLSDDMDALVKKYQSGTASIYDVWKGLAKELNGLTAQQQEAILKMTDYSQFADELESEATEYTEKIRETYETAGTYRQNYFIALLKDIGVADDVITNMAEYLGYSMTENEKYMESFSAKVEQLKIAWQELAVQIGEGQFGLLNVMKVITDLIKGILDLTEALGGLLPVASMALGLFIAFNGANIAGKFKSIGNNISTLIATMQGLRTESVLINATNAGISVGAAKLATSFGLVGAAIGTVVSVYSAAKTAYENMLQKQRDAANAAMDNAQSIQDLKQEYIDIVNMTGNVADKEEKLIAYKQKLIQLYGNQAEAIRNLNGEYAEEIDFLDEEYAKSIRNAYNEISGQFNKAQQYIEHGGKREFTLLVPVEADITPLEETFAKVKENTDLLFTDMLGQTWRNLTIDYGTENIQEQIAMTEQLLANSYLIDGYQGQITEQYERQKAILDKYGDTYTEYIDVVAQNLVLQNKTRETIRQINQLETDKQKEKALLRWANNMLAAGESSEVVNSALEYMRMELGLVEENSEDAGDALTFAFSGAETTLEEINENLKELNSNIDNFQSGVDTVIGAVNEFNSNGYLSIDTLQKLASVGYEYLSVLDFTSQGISVNNERLQSLLTAQGNNIDAMLQQAAAADIVKAVQYEIATANGDVEATTKQATRAESELTQQAMNMAGSLLAGTMSATEFNRALGIMTQGQDVNMARLTAKINDIISTYSALGRQMSSISSNVGAWSNAAASGASSAAKAAESAQKKALEARKKAIEEEKKAIKEKYDAEIEALRSVEAENDRIRKKEEYYRKRQEILDDIERAATRSGIEYREQEADARKRLEDLDREWLQTLQDWNIEDKIAELEAMRDAEIAALDEQIKLIEKEISELSVNIQGTLTGTIDTVGGYAIDAAESLNRNIGGMFKQTAADIIGDLHTLDDIMTEYTAHYKRLEGMTLHKINAPFYEAPSMGGRYDSYGSATNINNTMYANVSNYSDLKAKGKNIFTRP